MLVAAKTAPAILLAFDPNNRLAVRWRDGAAGLAFAADDAAGAIRQLEAVFPSHTVPVECFAAAEGGRDHRVLFTQATGSGRDMEISFQALDELAAKPGALSPPLARLLPQLEPFLVRIPYLHLGENDFIYKFRPAPERNTRIYAQDDASSALYQSRLCAAIKALARRHERTAAAPVMLEFGAIEYVIPSHFGFCLGVKNAIERAYETLAENAGRRVFMLSELIHNPFVNEDLLRRGLRYLQTDQGVPYATDGRPAAQAPGVPLLWDTLAPDDIVIIPAFGATDEDKARLVRKGIAVCQYDATCMLVEKVWKSARAYGREGRTIVIHGKHEHEETKATFSNTRRHAPAVIVRNLAEARQLGAIIASSDPAFRARFFKIFSGRHTAGFDVARDLERIAVVNQTTLLMNETLAIIDHLRAVSLKKFGDDSRVGGSSRRDTLCYATQVNQDALSRALAGPLDAAFVIGGKNSSNTYQLYRLCEQRLGPRAYFIQSEANIQSREFVDHYLYVGAGAGRTEPRPLWPAGAAAGVEGEPYGGVPKRVLVTGGASCPDGIIQQVIARLNALVPSERLRPIEAVLGDLERMNPA